MSGWYTLGDIKNKDRRWFLITHDLKLIGFKKPYGWLGYGNLI